jgi:hypothetical protein
VFDHRQNSFRKVFIQNSGAVSYTVSPQQYHRDPLQFHMFCPLTLDLCTRVRTAELALQMVEWIIASFL